MSGNPFDPPSASEASADPHRRRREIEKLERRFREQTHGAVAAPPPTGELDARVSDEMREFFAESEAHLREVVPKLERGGERDLQETTGEIKKKIDDFFTQVKAQDDPRPAPDAQDLQRRRATWAAAPGDDAAGRAPRGRTPGAAGNPGGIPVAAPLPPLPPAAAAPRAPADVPSAYAQPVTGPIDPAPARTAPASQDPPRAAESGKPKMDLKTALERLRTHAPGRALPAVGDSAAPRRPAPPAGESRIEVPSSVPPGARPAYVPASPAAVPAPRRSPAHSAPPAPSAPARTGAPQFAPAALPPVTAPPSGERSGGPVFRAGPPFAAASQRGGDDLAVPTLAPLPATPSPPLPPAPPRPAAAAPIALPPAPAPGPAPAAPQPAAPQAPVAHVQVPEIHWKRPDQTQSILPPLQREPRTGPVADAPSFERRRDASRTSLGPGRRGEREAPSETLGGPAGRAAPAASDARMSQLPPIGWNASGRESGARGDTLPPVRRETPAAPPSQRVPQPGASGSREGAVKLGRPRSLTPLDDAKTPDPMAPRAPARGDSFDEIFDELQGLVLDTLKESVDETLHAARDVEREITGAPSAPPAPRAERSPPADRARPSDRAPSDRAPSDRAPSDRAPSDRAPPVARGAPAGRPATPDPARRPVSPAPVSASAPAAPPSPKSAPARLARPDDDADESDNDATVEESPAGPYNWGVRPAPRPAGAWLVEDASADGAPHGAPHGGAAPKAAPAGGADASEAGPVGGRGYLVKKVADEVRRVQPAVEALVRRGTVQAADLDDAAAPSSAPNDDDLSVESFAGRSAVDLEKELSPVRLVEELRRLRRLTDALLARGLITPDDLARAAE